MKVIIIDDSGDDEVVRIKGFGKQNPKEEADMIVDILLNDISSMLFDKIKNKLKKENYI